MCCLQNNDILECDVRVLCLYGIWVVRVFHLYRNCNNALLICYLQNNEILRYGVRVLCLYRNCNDPLLICCLHRTVTFWGMLLVYFAFIEIVMMLCQFVAYRTMTFWGMIMGYFAYLSSRVWFGSFVPTWWNNQSNNIVIAFAAIATLDKIMSGEVLIKPGNLILRDESSSQNVNILCI